MIKFHINSIRSDLAGDVASGMGHGRVMEGAEEHRVV